MIKGWLVDRLEWLCSMLDHLPIIWYVPDYGWSASWWNGQLGCLIGVADWAVALDDHWHTGHWTSPAEEVSK